MKSSSRDSLAQGQALQRARTLEKCRLLMGSSSAPSRDACQTTRTQTLTRARTVSSHTRQHANVVESARRAETPHQKRFLLLPRYQFSIQLHDARKVIVEDEIPARAFRLADGARAARADRPSHTLLTVRMHTGCRSGLLHEVQAAGGEGERVRAIGGELCPKPDQKPMVSHVPDRALKAFTQLDHRMNELIHILGPCTQRCKPARTHVHLSQGCSRTDGNIDLLLSNMQIAKASINPVAEPGKWTCQSGNSFQAASRGLQAMRQTTGATFCARNSNNLYAHFGKRTGQ